MFTQLMSSLHYKIVANAPKVLAVPSHLVPFSLQHKCLSEVLSRLFKEAISEGELDFLTGKWLQITISDLNLTWYLSFEDDVIVIKEKVIEADVSFTAPLNELILVVGRKEDPDTLFFQRRLSIEGDTELGLEVKNLLDNIEFENLPDIIQKWIQHLSSFVKSGLSKPLTNDKVKAAYSADVNK